MSHKKTIVNAYRFQGFGRWPDHGWFLILDNADDLDMARRFIPSGRIGHMIFTTQARAVGAVAQLVEIQGMGIEEGTLFLLRRSRWIADEAAEVVDWTRAKEIVAQLDGLPLALDQAGAYIEETGGGLSGYLNLYQTHTPKLFRRRGALASDHPKPVAATWSLSFEKIEQANSAAAELLRVCAFLHSDGIPEEVFSKGAPELGAFLETVGSDKYALDEAISEILKYSLLRRDPNIRTLEMHRLVQAVLKQGMTQTVQRLWAERAVRAVNRTFPKVEFSTWKVCERLLPQAQICAELITQWGFEFTESALLLNQAGLYLDNRGRYTDAEPFYKRALAIREKTLDPQHQDVATSLSHLAKLYKAQGQYAKAEPLYKRALAIREKAFDPKHVNGRSELTHFRSCKIDPGWVWRGKEWS
jgi:tetratricopeptide (TPR) repeat protein